MFCFFLLSFPRMCKVVLDIATIQCKVTVMSQLGEQVEGVLWAHGVTAKVMIQFSPTLL